MPLKFGDDTVIILFKSINNQLYLDDLQNISIAETESIANEHDNLVLKVGLGGLSSGKDVKFFDNYKRNFSIHAIHESGIKDFLIQPVIKQSKTMNLFSQSSINTLRFTTYRAKTGETIILGAIVRFGKKGSKYDNAHKGGKFITIDKNGITSNQARDEFGNNYTEEQLNTRFSSLETPNWSEITSFIKKSHKKLPYHRIVAWDVTINQNNIPKIVEINLREPSLWLHEFDQGTAFGEYTNEVLELIKK
nr:sugar-transfer associated ATP-grasp domain-containing protein [Enterococcus lemanii]